MDTSRKFVAAPLPSLHVETFSSGGLTLSPSTPSIDVRISKAVDQLRTQIDAAVPSVLADIRESNVNNVVLALTNGVAGAFLSKSNCRNSNC
jgi:hypothetical protein